MTAKSYFDLEKLRRTQLRSQILLIQRLYIVKQAYLQYHNQDLRNPQDKFNLGNGTPAELKQAFNNMKDKSRGHITSKMKMCSDKQKYVTVSAVITEEDVKRKYKILTVDKPLNSCFYDVTLLDGRAFIQGAKCSKGTCSVSLTKYGSNIFYDAKGKSIAYTMMDMTNKNIETSRYGTVLELQSSYTHSKMGVCPPVDLLLKLLTSGGGLDNQLVSSHPAPSFYGTYKIQWDKTAKVAVNNKIYLDLVPRFIRKDNCNQDERKNEIFVDGQIGGDANPCENRGKSFKNIKRNTRKCAYYSKLKEGISEKHLAFIEEANSEIIESSVSYLNDKYVTGNKKIDRKTIKAKQKIRKQAKKLKQTNTKEFYHNVLCNTCNDLKELTSSLDCKSENRNPSPTSNGPNRSTGTNLRPTRNNRSSTRNNRRTNSVLIESDSKIEKKRDNLRVYKFEKITVKNVKKMPEQYIRMWYNQMCRSSNDGTAFVEDNEFIESPRNSDIPGTTVRRVRRIFNRRGGRNNGRRGNNNNGSSGRRGNNNNGSSGRRGNNNGGRRSTNRGRGGSTRRTNSISNICKAAQARFDKIADDIKKEHNKTCKFWLNKMKEAPTEEERKQQWNQLKDKYENLTSK